MLDIKQIIANPEETKKRLSLRKPALAAQIDEVLEKYESYKKILASVEEMRATACPNKSGKLRKNKAMKLPKPPWNK